MTTTATHSETRTCIQCGHEGPEGDFRPRRRGARLHPKCWLCRYLAAKTPRARLDALPPGPFDAGAPAASSDAARARLTRTCRKCGAEKPLAEFYLDRERGRRHPPCRRCIRAAMRRYYAENRERLIPVRRRWAAQEDPEQRRARQRRCRRRNQLQYAVRARTNRLRVLGVLTLAAECADCGGPATDLHHETYGDVCALVSLCRRCHMARHYRYWRKHGGGPVKYPWEHDQEDDSPPPVAHRGQARTTEKPTADKRGRATTDFTNATDGEKKGTQGEARRRRM